MSGRKSTKIERICEVCGKSFFVKPSILTYKNPRFCSWACRRSTKIERRCESCGLNFFVRPNVVKTGNPRFCSMECLRKNSDLSGRTFGRWSVISRADDGQKYKKRFNCTCECGTTKIVDYANLTSGASISCGCYNEEISTSHGHSRNGAKSPTYLTWQSMLARCRQENHPGYESYGGRGISVCERWTIFENFLEDIGERPKGMTIDRFPDQNGNYEKSNCRWATPKQQSRNMRNNRIVVFNGESRCLSEWSEILGISRGILERRLKLGWPVEQILTAKAGTRTKRS